MSTPQLYTYRAEIELPDGVIDGDTLKFKIDLGFGLDRKVGFYPQGRYRLAGINTPDGEDPQGRDQATARVRELLSLSAKTSKDGNPVIVVRTGRPDKYGRYLADVWIETDDPEGTIHLNEQLVTEGLAVPYDGGKR